MRPSKEKIQTKLSTKETHALEAQCATDWRELRSLEEQKAESAKEYKGKIDPLKKRLDMNSLAVKTGILEETRECFVTFDYDRQVAQIFLTEDAVDPVGERPMTDDELNNPMEMEFGDQD